MRIRYAGCTHVGLKRASNEDNFSVLADENLYIVADGMGGHASGEVASKIAVETVVKFFVDTSGDRESTWPYREDRELSYDENRLVNGIKLANRRIYEASQSEPRYRGMGTTIVSLLFGSSGACLGHVGDSRGYKLANGSIDQLTEDHSLLNDYLKVHELTAEEIDNFPHKNVIVRALGMKEAVAVDIYRLEPTPGDVYLLCSDGLSAMVSDKEIQQTVEENRPDLDKACKTLIAEANSKGGSDNITCVLVEFIA